MNCLDVHSSVALSTLTLLCNHSCFQQAGSWIYSSIEYISSWRNMLQTTLKKSKACFQFLSVLISLPWIMWLFIKGLGKCHTHKVSEKKDLRPAYYVYKCHRKQYLRVECLRVKVFCSTNFIRPAFIFIGFNRVLVSQVCRKIKAVILIVT